MMSKKKAPSTKKLNATNAELKKTLSVVRSQLAKSETKLAKANEKAERWKTEAATQRMAASRSAARVEKLQKKLQKKLDRAAPEVNQIRDTEAMQAPGPARPLAGPTAADGVTVPDETWSLVQLKAEARARGLVGMSNKPKAFLLAALS